MTEQVHSDDPADILVVDLDKPHEGRDSEEQDDRQDQHRKGHKALAERGGLGHQCQGHDRTRQRGKEGRRATRRLIPAHGPSRQQAPVLGREDLETQGRGQFS